MPLDSDFSPESRRWLNRKGEERGGQPFTRTSLHRLLTNVAYTGKTRYKTEVHQGEHLPIVDTEVFQRVQSLLRQNKVAGAAEVRNAFGFVLKREALTSECLCSGDLRVVTLTQ